MCRKLYYIHGYQSSTIGDKAVLFKEKLNAIPIRYRDVPPENLKISDCLDSIFKNIKDDDNVVLIGSSLGGYLAASIALYTSNVKKLILLNPAIIPPTTNIDLIKDMPKKILADMINKNLFEKKLNAEIYIFRGTKDTVVPDNWIIEFASIQEANLLFLHDDHRFSKYLQQLPKLISNKLE